MNYELLFGRGKIKNLGPILENWHCSKIMLITGKGSYDNSPKKKELSLLLDKFSFFRYCDFDVNPNIKDILNGLRIVDDYLPDTIIGLGGGSVLDTAKLLSVLPFDLSQIDKVLTGEKVVRTRPMKLILIPTTAGSGSEATQFAVLYRNGKKFSVQSPWMLPDMIVLDSEFTDTMPKKLTAITAFDALCQAIESYWSINADIESRKYASASLKIIVEILPGLLNAESNHYRNEMLRASFLAGKAINISKTTAPHALSYSLTQKYGIPHGLAVILTMAATFTKNANSQSEIVSGHKERIEELYKLLKVRNEEEFVKKINAFIELAGFRTGLKNYGVEKENIAALADSINYERLNNNPIKLSKSDINQILRCSM